MARLSATQLRKHYKKRAAVKDVSMTINSGQIVGLLGPNGAGKTTSFYMVVGLVFPDHGTIKIDDLDITYAPMSERAKLGIGYLPQEKSIFRKMTVEDNIMAILELRKDLNKAQRQEKQDALLSEFNITHLREFSAMSLSGGETRRVEIARALAMDPKFILLDEPFAGIDPLSVIDIKKIITHLSKRGIGILITDHNVRETLSICEHAYIASEGNIIAEGTAQTILENEQVRKVYLGEDFCL